MPLVRSYDYLQNERPWYWNDPKSMPDERNMGRSGYQEILGIQRHLDIKPFDHDARFALADAFRDIGDEEAADFYDWLASEQRLPYDYNGFWWYDNQFILPSESPYRIPALFIGFLHTGEVRYPAPGGPIDPNATNEDRAADPLIEWDRVLPNQGNKIVRLGFDGRLLAETTLLQCWRLATPDERNLIRLGDYEFHRVGKDKPTTDKEYLDQWIGLAKKIVAGDKDTGPTSGRLVELARRLLSDARHEVIIPEQEANRHL